jgi:hypothetical protein
MFVVVELLFGTQGRRLRERERLSINNITYICESRGYKDMY